MDVPIGHIFEGELPAGGSEIPLLIPIALKVAIDGAHEGETTDIELPILIQQWLFYILLYNERSLIPIDIGVLDKSLDLLQVFTDLDSTPPVGVLTRLNDPQALSELGDRVQDRSFAAFTQVSKELFKFQKLGIVEPLFDVEGEWQVLVVVLP